MKKIKLFTIIAIAAIMSISCEKDETKAVLDNSKATAPSIITPADQSTYQLDIAHGRDTFETIAWSKADYGITLSQKSRLEIDFISDEFTAPKMLITTTGNEYKLTNADLNILMHQKGLYHTEAHDLFLRVIITAYHDSVDELVSETNKFTVTPFAYVKPTLTAPAGGQSFVLTKNNAEESFAKFEWEETNYGGGLEVEYYIEIDTVGNNFADAEEIAEKSGTSHIAQNKDVNKALLKLNSSFEVAGNYEIRVASKVNGAYAPMYSDPISITLTSYDDDPLAGITKTLYLIGDASDAGWDAAAALPMNMDEPGIFSITTTLNADAGEGFKFLTTVGNWEPMYGRVADEPFEGGSLVYRAIGDPDVPSIPPPPTTGSYLIEVDLVKMTYKVTAQ